MGLSFQDMMRHDAEQSLLNVAEHARPIVHYPAGNRAAGATINAIVNRDDRLIGFVPIDSPGGRKVVHQALLTMMASVVVTESQEPLKASIFVFDGCEWYCDRITRQDEAMQEVQVKTVSGSMGFTKPSR